MARDPISLAAAVLISGEQAVIDTTRSHMKGSGEAQLPPAGFMAQTLPIALSVFLSFLPPEPGNQRLQR
ncbi:unnamed protein product [Gadus morhua 'NCC']